MHFLSPTQPNADGTAFFGSPTKIFEYLSMGRPILASDLEQLTEIIKPALLLHQAFGNNEQQSLGIIVDPKDGNAFIQAAHALATIR